MSPTPVPVASVNEDRDTVPRQHDVRRARKIRPVQAVAHTSQMQGTAKLQFGSSALTSYT